MFSKNTKMKKTEKASNAIVYDFALPAIKTCPFAGDCKKGCYATQGTYNFSNVKAKHEQNLQFTKSKDFVQKTIEQVQKLQIKAEKQGKQLYIRIHSSGDYYSKPYAKKWLAIALANPTVKFYSYTKSVPFFLNLNLPENFAVIFSFGGKHDAMIDVNKHRHAKVFDSEQNLLKAKYANAMSNDLIACNSSNPRIGLVYHGFESKRFAT